MTSTKRYIKLLLSGFCMGAADIVPGVSGGTMAFILGIYEELIDSIRAVGRPEFFRALIRFRIQECWRLINANFLIAVGAGIFLAILTLAQGLEHLLETQPTYVWSSFFGLVLASVFVVAARIKKWTLPLIIAGVIGMLFAYKFVGFVPVETPTDSWFIILSGAISICAMILPGISGSFLLVLLGKYEYILSAVNNREFDIIILFMIGAVIGIVLFAQFLSWLLHHYHDLTIALLTGLMVGSLRRVWPWKSTTNGAELLQENTWPGGMEDLGIWGCMAIGFLLVFLLERFASTKK